MRALLEMEGARGGGAAAAAARGRNPAPWTGLATEALWGSAAGPAASAGPHVVAVGGGGEAAELKEGCTVCSLSLSLSLCLSLPPSPPSLSLSLSLTPRNAQIVVGKVK